MSRRRTLMLAVLTVAISCCGFRRVNASVDHIFFQGFEESAVPVAPRTEFRSDQLLLFSSKAREADVAVRVFDADGDELSDATVTWNSSDPAHVTVQATGPLSAHVSSTDAWTAPIEVTATHALSGTHAAAKAIFAVPSDETILISSASITSISGDRANTHQLVLEKNAVTQAIQAGQIIVTGDVAGVMVRVLHTTVGTQDVTIEAEPALVTDAFETIEIDEEGEPLRISVEIEPTREVSTVTSLRTGALLSRHVANLDDILDLLQCSGGLEIGSNLTISTLSLETDILPRAGLSITGHSVQQFYASVESAVDVSALVSAELGTTVALQGECKAQLPEILLSTVPLAPFSLIFSLAPEVGVQVAATSEASVNWTPIQGFHRHWTGRAGVQYSAASGWSHIAEAGFAGEDPEATLETQGAVELKIAGITEAKTAVRLDLGLPPFGLEIARFSFFKLDGGPYLKFEMSDPIDPAKPAYSGPTLSAGVEATAGLEFKAEPFHGTLGRYLPITLASDLDFKVFSEDFKFYETPKPTGTVTCVPSCDSVPVDGTGVVMLDGDAATTSGGQIEFWGGRDADPTLMFLAGGAFSVGSGSASFLPPPTMPEGTWRTYARLKLSDPEFALTALFPLASEALIGSFTIATNGDCEYSSGVVDDDILNCFPDPGLRGCIDFYYYGEIIDQVIILQCDHQNILDITGVRIFRSTQEMNFSFNEISDISELRYLTSLNRLDMQKNQISDVGPLSNLPKLQFIGLNYNRINDLNAFFTLPSSISLLLGFNFGFDGTSASIPCDQAEDLIAAYSPGSVYINFCYCECSCGMTNNSPGTSCEEACGPICPNVDSPVTGSTVAQPIWTRRQARVFL